MRKTSKLLGSLAVAGMIAASPAAFTSTNTVAASAAGTGTTAIGAYATSNIVFDANDTNPENLDSVTFTLDKVAAFVAIRTHATGTWFKSDDLRLTTGTVDSCTSANSLTWTCNVTGASETVLGADSLTVVATS